MVREGSVSVAEGDCCEFDSVLQFCTVQFCLRGAWEAAVELSSDQAGRGGLSSSRIGAILPLFKQSFASFKVVEFSSACTRQPPAWALNRPPVAVC